MRGVGWAICYQNPANGSLSNHWISLHEVGNIAGFVPVLVMDVWEHAYLLDYKPAERPKYIEAFFSNIDWGVVDGRVQLKEALLIGAGLKMQRIEREMKSLTNENTRLGFIGIGNMGSRMAKRLLEHGYQVMAYNRSREAAEALVKYGATVAVSIAELASKADVILSSLSNDDAVKSVYTDPHGVFAYVRRGSAIIEMSTLLPATSRELCDLSREAGVKCLDSPVSGSTPSAEAGKLTLFCGGDEELFEAAQPIFTSIASQYFYLGSSGSGTAMKLVANTLLGVGMQAIAEAVAFGQKEDRSS